MFSKYMSGKSALEASGFGFLLLVMMVAIPAYAQGSTPPAPQGTDIYASIASLSPQAILQSLQNTLPNLMRMVTAISYVLGIYMVISGVIELKHVGEMRTQMSYDRSLTKPLVMIVIGSLLIYLPSSVQVGMSTFWNEPNPYGYIIQSDQWQQVINLCYGIVQFVGVIAFIRGLVLLSHVGGGGQQGTFARGLTHVIGGIFCININQFIQVLLATIGVQS